MGEKVKAALAVDELSMHYKVQFDPGEAVEFAESPRTFISCSTLAEMIASVNALVPTMHYNMLNGERNPNHGRTHHKWFVGREYSRVLYLRIAKSYMPKFGWDGPFELALEQIGSEHGADEMTMIKNDEREFCYRWWWD